ncbi:MAG: hypothetical protein ABW168_26260 [Sedimenticola sp.]
MSKPDIQIVLNMLSQGRANDLVELMLGESHFSIENKPETPKNKEESRKWRMALSYVEFVAKFGLGVEKGEYDGKAYISYPDDFQKWLEIGAPGISQEEISEYLTNLRGQSPLNLQ